MKSIFKILVALTAISLLCQECSIVPLTGRKQLNLLPESEMISMSLISYTDFMKVNPLSVDRINSDMVKEVGSNISASVIRYFTDNNLSSRLDEYRWEFNLVKNDSTPNAWCMPGGKVVVYSGILPYTKDKNGLAVVISHEIAHAVARHGNERMSQELLAQFGNVALDQVMKKQPEQTRSIFNSAYGLGAAYGVMLPFSRDHELEADKLGLIFMAMAGYDPQTAIVFWDRMSKIGGSRPPEFMSTHPSDARRIAKIKAALPEAMQYYKK